MLARLAKSVNALVEKRKALGTRERQVITDLRRSLSQLGYQLVSVGNGKSPRSGRRRRKSLRCPRCGRRFALPLHLGRHVAAIHRAKTTRRPRRMKKRRKAKR